MGKRIKLGKRYFMKMKPIRRVPFIGWIYTTSSDPDVWVECEVVESTDNIIVLQALCDGFGNRRFTRMYFDSYIKDGGDDY